MSKGVEDMQIGRKIYYDITTGVRLINTGEHSGEVIATTIEQDIATYRALSERNRDTFDVLELPFGAYSQDFVECASYRVNPETKTLEFSYPDPNEPDVEQPYQAPLSEKVAQLEIDQAATDTTLLELMESLLS